MSGGRAARRPVVLVADRLSKRSIADVAMACERLGASAVVTDGAALRGGADGAVLVGALRAGERQIPRDWFSWLCARRDTSLLLLCDEALVRPCVSLYSGRVALLGAGCKPESIAGRIRVLLVERLTAEGAAGSDERAYPSWWSRDADARGGGSRIFAEGHGGFALLFSVRGAPSLDPSEIELIRAALRPETVEDAVLDESMRAHAGDDVAVLRYMPATREWLFYWPPRAGTLWLLSPTRLPILSDLSCIGEMRRMPASSGDVLVAFSQACTGATAELARDVVGRVDAGGPAVFDAVSAGVASMTEAWATVAELR